MTFSGFDPVYLNRTEKNGIQASAGLSLEQVPENTVTYLSLRN